MPTKTPLTAVKQIVKARWRRRLGPAQIGGELGIPASTVHAVLVRARINRLSHIDRVTGEPIRCYEHDHPGSMIHVDVTKFGNIPDGGGWRYVGILQGDRNRANTTDRGGSRHAPKLGTAFLHTVIDDHSRVAYVEICADERADTAAGVLRRAVRWFADRGVSIERFHRTLAEGWAYARYYDSESSRRDALPGWLHFYNHHRHHSAIGAPPISRLNNLAGHHI